MDIPERGSGLAVLIHADGRIEETIRLPSNCLIGPGVPFEAIIDAASRPRAVLFLEEVKRAGAVFGWEMTSFIAGEPRPYIFAGLRLENQFLVFCALFQEDLFRLFEEVTAVTEVRPEIWRAALRRLAESLSRRTDVRTAEVDELSRLNAELKALKEELTRKNANLEELNAEIQRLADTDVLTGLLNRRGFYPGAERDFLRAQRHGQGFAVIMIDIDHFKNINDRWGHLVGDQALSGLAEILKKASRESDLLARYGGEEFILLVVNGDPTHARQAAERIRSIVEATEIPTDAGPLQLTISLGVSLFNDKSRSLDDVIAGADIALYQAKRAGRNRVKTYRPD